MVRAWQAGIAHVPQTSTSPTARWRRTSPSSASPAGRSTGSGCATRGPWPKSTNSSRIQPQGYESRVGQRARRTAVGRAAAAHRHRACAIQGRRDADLDEATSALDNETERSVMDEIEALDRGAHHPPRGASPHHRKHCDSIVELARGRAIALAPVRTARASRPSFPGGWHRPREIDYPKIPCKPMFNDKAVLITGGTGSFGRRFVETVLRASTAAQRHRLLARRATSSSRCSRSFASIGPIACASSSATCATRDRLTLAMRGVDYRHPRRGAEAGAGGRIQPVRMHPHQRHRAPRTSSSAALRNGVRRVIALSTDKAANPINLYGATKLASDKIFVAANNLAGGDGTRFAVVRYGNVVGSRGSVMPLFQKLVAEGADYLPITDARMTRFWITLQQGVDFVLTSLRARCTAARSSCPRSRRMRIIDLADGDGAGPAGSTIVGIRPGEKLHEMMIPGDDSRLTLELADRYVIEPTIPFVEDCDYRVNAARRGGRPVRRRASSTLPARNPHLLTSRRSARCSRGHGMIPYGRQDISDDDIDAVVEVLRSDFLTQGPAVPRSSGRSPLLSARARVAVNSATAGAAPGLPGARPRPGRRACGRRRYLRRLGQLRALLRRRGGLRRHRSAHLQPRASRRWRLSSPRRERAGGCQGGGARAFRRPACDMAAQSPNSREHTASR